MLDSRHAVFQNRFWLGADIDIAPVDISMSRSVCLGLIGAAALLLSRSASVWAEDAPPARFHHVMLNSVDPQKSIQFYSRVFGASPIKFRGVADALFTEKSFILFNKVDQPPDGKLNTGIWHIGWGGVDVKNEYEWWKRHNVDIHTPLSPLPGVDNFYMYINGPDKELIEINTMGHHRFAHVHFFCDDVNESVGWYAKHLGLKPRRMHVERSRKATCRRWPASGST